MVVQSPGVLKCGEKDKMVHKILGSCETIICDILRTHWEHEIESIWIESIKRSIATFSITHRGNVLLADRWHQSGTKCKKVQLWFKPPQQHAIYAVAPACAAAVVLTTGCAAAAQLCAKG